jgi:hypothetical protein
MNKREVVWLIVRLIGLYFAYTAIVALFILVSTIWMLFSAPSAKSLETDGAPPDTSINIPGIGSRPEPTPSRSVNKIVDAAADEARRAIFKQILWYIFLLALQGGVGYYLLFHGGMVFNLLMRENKPGERKEREPESILLNLTE